MWLTPLLSSDGWGWQNFEHGLWGGAEYTVAGPAKRAQDYAVLSHNDRQGCQAPEGISKG